MPDPAPARARRRISAALARWRDAASYLPAIVLVAVALNQIRLVHTRDLLPWKGGGFGMFATVDAYKTRSIRAYALGPEPGQEARLPPVIFGPHRAAEAYPSDANLSAHAEWLRPRARYKLPGAVAVRVEVWRTRYDPETRSHVTQKLREYVHELGDDGA